MDIVVERSGRGHRGWKLRNSWNDNVIGRRDSLGEAVAYAQDYAYYQDFDEVVVKLPPKQRSEHPEPMGGSGPFDLGGL